MTDSAFPVVAVCGGLAFAALLRFELFVYGFVFLLPCSPLLDAEPRLRHVSLFLRFVLLAGVWAARRRQGKSFLEWVAGSRLKKSVLVFLGVATISLLVSRQHENVSAYRSLVRLFSYAQVFFAMAGWLESRRQVIAVITLVLVSTIGVALFGFYQVYARGYTDLYFRLYPLQKDALEPWTGRITSFLFHSNVLAGYLNLVLPVSIACMVFGRDRALRVLALGCHSVGAAAIYFTASRGGLVAYAGMLLICVWFLKPRRAGLMKVLVSLVLAAGLVLSLPERSAAARVLDLDQSTRTTRLALWGAAGRMFLGHPVLGVGFGNYRSLYGNYLPGVPPNEVEAHNLYLQLLAETGAIGLLVFGVLAVAFARLAIKLARQSDPFCRMVGVGMGGALAATLIHGMVDYIFNVSPHSEMFWLVLGLGVAVFQGFSETADQAFWAQDA